MLHQRILTLPESPPRAIGAYDDFSSRVFCLPRARLPRSRVAGGGVARTAFTLLELLVVVAIIVVLVTLLLPVLAMTRANCAQVVCSSRLKELVIACQL